MNQTWIVSEKAKNSKIVDFASDVVVVLLVVTPFILLIGSIFGVWIKYFWLGWVFA